MQTNGSAVQPLLVADGCRRCPQLVANRRRIVHGWGMVPARVMIVGEAPGVRGADRTGVPFTGDRSGRRLQALLIRLGLSLATDPADPAPPLRDCFLSNAVRCNPPRNRQPTRTEIAACAMHLLAELALVRPRLIVAVGGVATRVLAAHLLGWPLPPIRQAHARPVTLPEGRWLLPMLHPSRASNAALDEVAAVMAALLLTEPLPLPEHARVEIRIVAQSPAEEERQRVRQALLEAGVIRPRPPVERVPPVSDAELAAAANVLAAAGPLSELIIAERDG